MSGNRILDEIKLRPRRWKFILKEWRKPILYNNVIVRGEDVRVEGDWVIFTATDGIRKFRMDVWGEDFLEMMRMDRDDLSYALLALKSDIYDVIFEVPPSLKGKTQTPSS